MVAVAIVKLEAWIERNWFIFFWYVDNLAGFGETNYIWHERTGIWKKQQEKKVVKLSQLKVLDETDKKPIAVASDKLNK